MSIFFLHFSDPGWIFCSEAKLINFHKKKFLSCRRPFLENWSIRSTVNFSSWSEFQLEIWKTTNTCSDELKNFYRLKFRRRWRFFSFGHEKYLPTVFSFKNETLLFVRSVQDILIDYNAAVEEVEPQDRGSLNPWTAKRGPETASMRWRSVNCCERIKLNQM